MDISTLPPGLVPKDLRGYYLALLKRGPRWAPGDPPGDLMARHLAFLRDLILKKRCVFAGPTLDDGPIIGMCILDAASTAAAQQLMEGDPEVAEGRTLIEVHPMLLPSLDALSVKY